MRTLRKARPHPLIPIGFAVVFALAYGFTVLHRLGGALAVAAVIVGLASIGGAIAGWRLRARRRAEQARIDESRPVILEQLDAIAGDILRLEGEVRAAGNEEALARFRDATATYTEAVEAFEVTDTAAELTDLAARLDVAIWQLDTTGALLDGEPLPPQPPAQPAVVPTGPAPERRPGRTTAVGVLETIAAMLEGRPMGRPARWPTGRRHAPRHWSRIGPMGMGASMMDDECWDDGGEDEKRWDVLPDHHAASRRSDDEADAMRRRPERMWP